MNEVNERIFISQDWVTLIFIFTVGLIVLDKLLKPNRFAKIKTLLYSDIYIGDYSKSTAVIMNMFTYIFVLINSIVISLLLFIIINKIIYKEIVFENFRLFRTIFLSVFIYIILRTIIGYFISVVFEYEKKQIYISFLKTSYLSNFSLLILPLLLVNFYIDSLVLLYLLILISTLLLLYYYFKILKINQKLIFKGLFYFILYLCALEISPLLVFYKMALH